MIDVIKATEIMRKYCPETKLEIKNGADGLYLTESDIIWIGRDWHLGGLLHEITHAMLYKEDGRTGHDGVFADRLTQLVGEVFCDHIPQQEKKVSLTEQWKNGELEEGVYYINHELMGVIQAEYEANYNNWYNFGCDVELSNENIKEIIAPVPSYEEWQLTKYSLDDYKRLCDMRGKIIDKMEESNTDAEKHLRQENTKLKKLLKECREIFNRTAHTYKFDMVAKIDEVLK